MTELDRKGQDPVSVPFTPGMRDNPDELTAYPEEIASDFETPENPTPTEEFTAEWRNASYNCFSSGHKFCREVCPVMQVTRNESWTPTAFHANVVAMDRGRADHRGRRRRLRQLHPVRRLRAALPQHPLHRRLLPVPHPHRRRREGRPRVRGRERGAPAGVAELERPHRRAHPRAGARRDPGQPGARARLVRRAGHPDRRRDRAVRRLRGGVLPHLGPARGGPDPAAGGLRVRADGRAVVLRWPGRRDGVRRPGEAVRPAQPRQLALDRHEAGARARPARLHLVHRGLPEVLRRRLRHRGRARRRAVRRADPRGPADAVGPDRAGDHLPRPLPAQQAQGDLEGAARGAARDPRPGLHRRRPGDPVVLLLRRRWRAADREARAHRGDLGRPGREGQGARGGHPGQRLPLVRAPAQRGG